MINKWKGLLIAGLILLTTGMAIGTKWSDYADQTAGNIAAGDTFLVRDIDDATLAATGTQKEYPWSVMISDLTGALPYNLTTSGVPISVSAAQMNGIIFMTAAEEVLIPDVCDAASGKWLIVFNKTAANQVEVAVADTGNDKFVLIDGTATGVNDELDLSTDASSWVKVACLEANTWYVVAGVGATTDGGAAD